ncbi:hypothetical protein Tco_1578363 [Tanacetum coccineum]
MTSLIVQIWARSGFEGIEEFLWCRNEMERGLAQMPMIMGMSHVLRDDSRNRVPHSLSWREILYREGDRGNHPEDDFTPLETIRRSNSTIGKKISFELEGEAFELGRRVRHQRVSYDQRNNPLQYPRIVYPLILNINYFRHFLDILRNYDPIDDEPIWAADCVVAPTPGSAITNPEAANEFAIKGNHLTLVKGNQFDGRAKTNPHKHIHEFLRIYDMFKYRDTENEVVPLMMFPLSLTGEAKTWLDELNEGNAQRMKPILSSSSFRPTPWRNSCFFST